MHIFLGVFSSAIVIQRCPMLTGAACLAGFWYAIGGPHIYTTTVQHRKEMGKKIHPLPMWTKSLKLS